MDPLKVFIIDDEEHARIALKTKISENPLFEFAGEGEGITDSLKLLKDLEVDLIFLDVLIRQGDAFGFLQKLKMVKKSLPAIVINTAFAQFEYAQKALNEFGEAVIFILEKPFLDAWDQKEEDIIEKTINYRRKELPFTDKKYKLRTENSTFLIPFEEIISIATDDDKPSAGKQIFNTEKYGPLHVYESLNVILRKLPKDFIRINKRTIINIHQIHRFDHSNQEVYMADIIRPFPLGDAFKASFLKLLK